MVKKNKPVGDVSGSKAQSGKRPLEFFSIRFENVDTTVFRQHIFYLILASLMTKLLVLVGTPVIFHSFIDYFDIGFYLEHGVMLTQGQLPYVHYFFDYPVLIFIPIVIALVPALLFQNALAFFYSFQALMVLCDIVITVCVYLIALKLGSEKTALYAGLVYATAFSAAYFILTKYDAFPTCFLMIALLFTLYGQKIMGYLGTALGFFAKIFPIIALPFMVLYNTRSSSLKQEILNVCRIFIPLAVIFIVPFLFFGKDILRTYLPVRTGMEYYSNTATFTIYSWLHDVFGLGVSLDMVLTVMFAIMGIGLLALVYTAWAFPRKDPMLLLKLVLVAIVLVIFCVKVRSPQYIVWFTPILCILAVDDYRKIILVYLVQITAFIEFPLMFGAYYTSTVYTNPTLSGGWYLTLAAFTLEYLVLFVCLWFVINPLGIVRKLRMGKSKAAS